MTACGKTFLLHREQEAARKLDSKQLEYKSDHSGGRIIISDYGLDDTRTTLRWLDILQITCDAAVKDTR